MPREVSSTTPRRLKGSGPKKELKTPETVPLAMVSSFTAARPFRDSMKPPLLPRTAAMTATMPTSMIRPWMKSLTAVAI